MRFKNTISLVVLALVVSLGQARAAGIVLSWTAPTQNTDGTPLTNLASYFVEWSLCAVDGSFGATSTGSMSVNAPTVSATIANPPTGKVCARVSAKNSAGVMSDPSAVVSEGWPVVTVQPTKPKAPAINSMK